MEHAVPILIKVIIIFAGILILNRFGVHLAVSLIAGAVSLGLWMGLTPLKLIACFYKGVVDHQTISLAVIVWLIMVMSDIMGKSGHMNRLVISFTRIARDARAVGTVMSALIGLLPMPGGALFSAPMVDESLSIVKATPEHKTALNYWFRHIWEYWWPLYPGVILAIALLNVDTWRYMIFAVPMTLLSIGAGYYFIIKPMDRASSNTEGRITMQGVKAFIFEMMPISIIVLSIILITGLIRLIHVISEDIPVPSLTPVIIGLVSAIIWVCRTNRIAPSGLVKATLGRSNLTMILLIVAIMLFKGVMTDSGAVTGIRDELITYGIPPILLIIIMPFFSGIILGIAVGFVGASFPLIIPLFPADDTYMYLSYAALAYTFGYMGMMLSPVHLCFAVTRDYFKANISGSYSYIVKSSIAVLILAVLFFMISTFLHGLAAG
jgi:integral membrane protein (TIGR00529 family)